MTNEEKDRLIAYLVDAGEIDPEGDVEAQFLEWRKVHEQVVSGEVHYKAILEAAPDTEAELRPRLPSRLCRHVGADDCRQARPDDDSLDHPRPFHGVSDMPAPVGSHSPGPIDQVSDRSGTPRRSPAFPWRGSSGSGGCPKRRS